MKRRFALLGLLFLCLALFATTGVDNRYALVIGNAKYQENSLNNSVNDALLVADTLGHLGFDVTYQTDANGQEMRNVVADFSKKVNQVDDSVALFYYSGHGLQIDGVNYLVPVDNRAITNESSAKVFSYRLDDYLDTIKAPTQIIILDACRNNPYTQTGARGVAVKGGLATITGRKGASLSYLYSTQAGETAEDGTGINSLFTTVLVEEISKTNIELASVFNAVNNRVKEMTDGKQIPLFSGTGTNFYFVTPELADIEIAKWQAELDKAQKTLQELSTLSGRQLSLEQESKKAAAEASQRLAQAELGAAQARKARVLKEAQALEEERLAKAVRSAEQQKRIDEARASAEAAATEVRLRRVGVSTAQAQINFIEQQKLELRKIRDSYQVIIDSYLRDVEQEMLLKIEELQNRPYQAAELGLDGYPTTMALQMRKRMIEGLRKEYEGGEDEYAKQAYLTVAPQMEKIIDTVKLGIDSLVAEEFSESSVLDELRISLSSYDGERAGWVMSFESQLTDGDGKSAFKGEVFLPYSEVTGLPNNQITHDLEAYLEYLDQVDMYDSLFRASTPIITAEIKYKIAVNSASTVYEVTPLGFEVRRSDNNRVINVKLANPSNISKSVTIIPKPVIDIRTPEELNLLSKVKLTFTNYFGDIMVLEVPQGDPVTLPPFMERKRFTALAIGPYHALAVREDGALFATGWNGWGQLGQGHTSPGPTRRIYSWTRVVDDVVQVAAGAAHSLVLLSDGSAWSSGRNGYGQLGVGDRNTYSKLTPVLTEVKFIAAGGEMSFFIKKDDTLWVCGQNDYGQLGTGDTFDVLKPTKVMEGVLSVAAGSNHVLVLAKDGTLYSAGLNSYGQLGLGNKVNSSSFKKVTNNVKEVVAGSNHSLVVKKDGTVFGFGRNDCYQLGLNNTSDQLSPAKINLTGIEAVSAGADHSLFINQSGYLYAAGDNREGQCGNGDVSYVKTPTQIMRSINTAGGGVKYTLAIGEDGIIRHTGNNDGNFGVEWTASRTVNRLTMQNFTHTFWYSASGAFVPGATFVAKSSMQLRDSYKVGEIGPAGGYVFYDKGYYSDGWRYLEAAPAGWSGGKEDPRYVFGYYRPNNSNTTVGTESNIGSGKKNTELLVQRMGTQAYSSSSGSSRSTYAAKIADDYTRTVGGVKYDNWFLPSKDEIYLMCHHLYKRGLGGFSDIYYWSSSEGSNSSAWYQYFDGGGQKSVSRSNENRIRPIRSF